MFRLMKLVAYGLLGYAIYEFVRGMTHGTEGRQLLSGDAGGGREPGGAVANFSGGAARGEEGARTNMTGPGEGTPVATHESDGGSVPHRVGRGVVTR